VRSDSLRSIFPPGGGHNYYYCFVRPSGPNYGTNLSFGTLARQKYVELASPVRQFGEEMDKEALLGAG